MAKLYNKLNAKFESIKITGNSVVALLKDIGEKITSLAEHSEQLLDGLIQSSDQEEYFIGPFAALGRIYNVFVLIISNSNLDHLVSVDDVSISAPEDRPDDTLMLRFARRKLRGVLEKGEVIQQACKMMTEEVNSSIEVVSASRHDPERYQLTFIQDISPKLLEYENYMKELLSVAVEMDSHLLKILNVSSRDSTSHGVTAALTGPEEASRKESGDEGSGERQGAEEGASDIAGDNDEGERISTVEADPGPGKCCSSDPPPVDETELEVEDTGSDLDQLMRPMSDFDKSHSHGENQKKVIEMLKVVGNKSI